MTVNWLDILIFLAEGDAFGHESWFEIGVEQHKQYYYCLLGDCSVSEEVRKKAREGESSSEGLPFCGRDKLMESAIVKALGRWLRQFEEDP